MRSPQHAPRWSIPGVGALRPSFDRISIVSSRSVGGLKKLLPLADLKRVSHSFPDPRRYRGDNPRLQSIIDLVCPQTLAPLQILSKNTAALQRYSIIEVEIAFDVRAASIDDAGERQNALVGRQSKYRHRRRFLWSEHEPDKAPAPGKVSIPTYYFEHQKCGVRLKCYSRHEKLPGGRFGELILRLEWTLKGKPALTRHLGGNQIEHLLNADLNAFLERNLRLEEVDHVAFGNLFRWSRITTQRGCSTLPTGGGARVIQKQWRDENYRAGRAAFLVLRGLARREYGQGKFASWEQALKTCQHSPAQIRGYCRELRDGERQRRGRSKQAPRTQRGAITDYKINRCFRRVRPQRV
jgi:hypothetical protein